MRNETPYHHLVYGSIKAIQGGAEIATPARVKWNVAGACQCPQTVVRTGRPFRHHAARVGRSKILVMEVTASCRRCVKCLALRASIWTRRAMSEVGRSTRTWFGTLTLSPQEQMVNTMRARQLNPSFGSESEEARFKMLVAAAGPLVTKYLKRVRKEAGTRFRYMVVAERHKSGLPHFHILVHEMSLDGPVRKETLRSQWQHGFSRWKLADRWSARYVCKYLAKEAGARVRASRFYGDGEVVLEPLTKARSKSIGLTRIVGVREGQTTHNVQSQDSCANERSGTRDGWNLPREGISSRSAQLPGPRHSNGPGYTGERQSSGP